MKHRVWLKRNSIDLDGGLTNGSWPVLFSSYRRSITTYIGDNVTYISDSSTTCCYAIVNATIINKDYDEYQVWNSQVEAHVQRTKRFYLCWRY